MHEIRSTSTHARRAAVAAALCILPLFAACGDRGEPESAATTDTAAAQGDTSAMAVARRALGPGVRMAIPFRIPHRDARFIAAAVPLMTWVDDPARAGNSVGPGGHELVIVEATVESHAVHKPGLYATREPWLPTLDDTATATPADSATLARTMGVEDADGDGTPEVWAAQYGSKDESHTWDVRAYDRNGRTMYQVIATFGAAGGTVSRQDFSASAEQNPPARQWLEGKVRQLEAALASAPTPAGAAR